MAGPPFYKQLNRRQDPHCRQPAGEVTTYAYDRAGRRETIRRVNGTRTSFTYDNADQMTQIEHRRANGNMLSNFTYSYDAAGNRRGEGNRSGIRRRFALT